MMSSSLERILLSHCRAAGIEEPVREHLFHQDRKWRFDFAWPDFMIALEVEGGTWVNGRHNRPRGYESDAEKYNAAMVAGWSVLRATGAMVRSGRALETIARMISVRNGLKNDSD